MSWSHPLPTLQLVGVCIGGIVLAHICRAMAVNYKYLGSGLPDLLLIRLKSRGVSRGSGDSGGGDSSSTVSYKGEGGDSKCVSEGIRGGVGNGADGEGECIDLSVVLGESWERLGSPAPSLENKVKGRGRDDWELPQHSYKATSKPSHSKTNTAQVGYADEKTDTIGDGDGGEEYVSIEAADGVLSDSNITTTTADPFIYLGPDLTDLSHIMPTTTLTNTTSTTTTSPLTPNTTTPTTSDGVTCHVWDKYHCDAMFIEVKGPGDKLAPHQLLWQHILYNSGAHSIVGYVREEKLAGKIGMKLTSSGTGAGDDCNSSDDYSGHAYEN